MSEYPDVRLGAGRKHRDANYYTKRERPQTEPPAVEIEDLDDLSFLRLSDLTDIIDPRTIWSRKL